MHAVVAAAVAGVAGHRRWMNTAESPQQRAAKLVSEMTTAEKLSLMHGSCDGYTGNVCAIDRLGVPQLKFNDGPQGFRDTDLPGSTTSWPGTMTVAASWDPDLLSEWGKAMGMEFYKKGANVQLGPGVCVARVPRNGRNFEYISGEDPFLGYTLVQPVVRGIQSVGVVANGKHFVANNQETDRHNISSNVDERTLFEIYYPPFEGAVKAGLGSVMCSYNRICKDCPPGAIGNWSCENSDTLGDLKDRLGFQGWVMSDWGATHSTSINRGLDQEMPHDLYMGDTLTKMVAAGEVSMAKVDDTAKRILWPFFAVGVFDRPNNNTIDSNVSTPQHKALARNLSAQSTVLLQNKDGLLPIRKDAKNILVVGKQAVAPLVHGGGSGHVDAGVVSTPLDAIRAAAGLPPFPAAKSNCSDAAFETGIAYGTANWPPPEASAATTGDCCQLCADLPACHAFYLVKGECYMLDSSKNRTRMRGATGGTVVSTPVQPAQECGADRCVRFAATSQEAKAKAAAADVVLVFVGTASAEGSDRVDLTLGAEQEELVEAVAAVAGAKTAVVAATPGALLTPWRARVSAVLTPLMPGEQYGNAIADVLFGRVNPGGKLPVTFPGKENEIGMTDQQWPGVNGYSEYSEKLEVGYRWYAAHPDTIPAFPFGHGLSYTTFVYAALRVAGRSVTCVVKNAGSVHGAEVAQLYLRFPEHAGEPPMQLKGFEKVSLAPGQAAQVAFTLNDRDVSIWSTSARGWEVVSGSFGVSVGSSSSDIRLVGSMEV
eukprot:TRINITY_DN8468_c0_g1_i1.p1 TRINITY_DN8468_c0_g1~~TRINITY_DN8468_c0_g1_i1.p1  ORF type:complete len:787 (+),score=185.23 TRINITY_DN8468_c0_g1_i1:59-2362(+)